jgi:hypothetical protein
MPFIRIEDRMGEGLVLFPPGLQLDLLQLRFALLNDRLRLLNEIVSGGGVETQEKAPILAVVLDDRRCDVLRYILHYFILAVEIFGDCLCDPPRIDFDRKIPPHCEIRIRGGPADAAAKHSRLRAFAASRTENMAQLMGQRQGQTDVHFTCASMQIDQAIEAV